MSLTFKQIQDAVLADAFAESKRSDCKNWIQFRHAWLWDAEPWTFKFATATVTFAAGAQTVADAPTDLRAALAHYDTDGEPVAGIDDVRRFYEFYNANLGLTNGRPDAYTIVNGSLIVGPPGDGSTGLLVYEKTRPSLVNDSDTTGLPDGYDLALVHGGKAEGFKLTNIPLADNFDADFTAAVNALQRNYLSSVREVGGQMGAYRPGVGHDWW